MEPNSAVLGKLSDRLIQVVEACPLIPDIDFQASAQRVLEAAADFTEPDRLPELIVNSRMLLLLDLLPPELFSLKIIMAAQNTEKGKRIKKRSQQKYQEMCYVFDQADTNPHVTPELRAASEQMARLKVFTDDGSSLTEDYSFDHRKPCTLGGSADIKNVWVVRKELNEILGQVLDPQLKVDLEFKKRPFLLVVPNETKGHAYFSNYVPPHEKMEAIISTWRNAVKLEKERNKQLNADKKGGEGPKP